MAQIIDGKKLAEALTEAVTQENAVYCKEHPQPCLAIVSSGSDPASQVYIKTKVRALEKAGMQSRIIPYSQTISEQELTACVQTLNADDTVDGILIQLPLPYPLDSRRILAPLDPAKDVDGFTPENLGRLLIGSQGFIPCTPQGIMYALQQYGIPLSGAHAVIVGRSAIVGKPLAALLTAADATVTLCHSKTKELAALTRQADILIAAAGHPALITGSMIKKGAAVIDVGINRVPDPTAPKGSRLTGDIDFESAAEQAGWITPVPGGVGPLTVAMVLRNTLRAAQLRHGCLPEMETGAGLNTGLA
ncbi:bifunctional 5,10-methylenetetrahydrofolate dehydrogenase/5,10-methenyltetrahydrofolate cyclohydrolase [Treponema vincentii]|uniref:bifunctional 5,10-methylenetetrahydrofolate dehydrogenase/5,10-methenyltetrahydrofolate cyclohydrolase n=1 Tax=Treponema vincentii TaxID=69710 RepID=UPI001BAF853C|nr:bifunctional 5,10-methylenetetrahydrofolate dehydrogenase/5,10-methenyltetrahydrofolate cyclohydrolase [Treponema vincentii]QUY18131.1 bifunctional 5,10-methylenetetrahydrofolate dehydrogenase/5,10-methenyltetrahydrofolate cyclohydrolase [Treponema vincentii]